MSDIKMPKAFNILHSLGCINQADIYQTNDGFYMLYKSLSDILFEKNILDFPDVKGERLRCDRFFDDWYLYSVKNGEGFVYSLLKLREQENDAQELAPADSDIPGVTISFISYDFKTLLDCLLNPTDQNRERVSDEINRVVAYRGQKHHKVLKQYFKNPSSEASYLIGELYTRFIASFAKNGYLEVPEGYREIVQRSISYKKITKHARIPLFIEALNKSAGYTVCDNEKIYIKDKTDLNEYEKIAILATNTGNTSLYSFAAEVEFHARFLTPLAKIKIPFFGSSVYDSAIRADMTICDSELEGPTPYYQSNSKIVKRQYSLHHKSIIEKFGG